MQYVKRLVLLRLPQILMIVMEKAPLLINDEWSRTPKPVLGFLFFYIIKQTKNIFNIGFDR